MQKRVDVKLAGKIILKSSLNAPNNRQAYHCHCPWCCGCILHCLCRCVNLSSVQAPSLVALPLLCTVVSLLCLLILVVLYHQLHNQVKHSDYRFVRSDYQVEHCHGDWYHNTTSYGICLNGEIGNRYTPLLLWENFGDIHIFLICTILGKFQSMVERNVD